MPKGVRDEGSLPLFLLPLAFSYETKSKTKKRKKSRLLGGGVDLPKS